MHSGICFRTAPLLMAFTISSDSRGETFVFCYKEPGKQIARTASCSVQKTSKSIQKLYKHSTVHHGVQHCYTELCTSWIWSISDIAGMLDEDQSCCGCKWIETVPVEVWISVNGPPAPGLPHPKMQAGHVAFVWFVPCKSQLHKPKHCKPHVCPSKNCAQGHSTNFPWHLYSHNNAYTCI